MKEVEDLTTNSPIPIAVSAWGRSIGQSTTGPLSFLFDRLESQGFKVVAQEDSTAHIFVSIQHNRKAYKAMQRTKSLSHKILVSYEPKTVSAEEYRKSVVEAYDSVIRWSPLHRTSDRETVAPAGIYWHSLAQEHLTKHSSRIRNWTSIALINGHKHSLIKGSLYSLRRKVMETLAGALPGFSLALAGARWEAGKLYVVEANLRSLYLALRSGNMPDPRGFSKKIKKHPNLNIVGPVDDGLDFLSRATFAIVIENEATYVTEKLPNAILAGCVPIYCGPNLAEFDIPSGVCIQVEATPQSFVEAMEKVTPEIANAIKKAGQDWLLSPKTAEKYSYDSAMSNLADKIIQAVQLRRPPQEWS
jgi:hypothetical protein